MKIISYKNHLVVGLILAFVCLLAYSNGFQNRFIIDDHSLLVENPRLYSSGNLKDFFIRPDVTNNLHYRPLTSVVRFFLYQFFGDSAAYYRLFNLILLYLYCFLIYFLLGLIVKNVFISSLAAVLFAVHPINSMAVNYLTAHEVSLFGICLILSTICLLLAEKKSIFFYLSLIFFVLGILFQEIVVTFPIYAILVLWFVKQYEFKKALKYSLPFFLLVFVYLMVRIYFFNPAVIFYQNFTSLEFHPAVFVASAFSLIGWYVKRLSIPSDIVFIWNIQPSYEKSLWPLLGILLIIGSLIFLIFRWKKGLKTFFLLWFLAGFLPVFGAMFVMSSLGLVIEPHWFFFSSIGFFALCSLGMDSLREKMNPKIWFLLIFTTVLLLIGMTRQYNRLWKDDKTYCEYWLKLSPENHVPNFWLGCAYLDENDYEKAEHFFNRALTGTFLDWQVFTNLGLLELKRGHVQEALDYSLRAFKINPQSAVVYTNLGAIFKEKGKILEAEAAWQSAVKLDPYLLEPWLNLAGVYVLQDQTAQAEKIYKKILEINLEEENSLMALAEIYFKKNDQQSAFGLGKKILESSSDSLHLTAMGSLFARERFTKIAFAFFTKALNLDPLNKNAYFELGKLYGNLGQFNQAISVWLDGLRLNPENEGFKELIQEAQKLMEEKK